VFETLPKPTKNVRFKTDWRD